VKLLADENIEQPIIDVLRADGHDVVGVAEVAPGSSDQEVLRLANDRGCIVLTNDKDFGELCHREGRVAAGVVLLRFRSEDGAEKARKLCGLLREIGDRIEGHFAVVTDHGTRLRPVRHPRAPG